MGEQAPTTQQIRAIQFDYAKLDAKTATRARAAATRIREAVKKTLEQIIEVGSGLSNIKNILPHGAFGPWLKAEFGWSQRMAENFINVSETFGPKVEIISDLKFQPTAAYLLAAPSVPDEARAIAVERAQAGEVITTKAAKTIVRAARKKAPTAREGQVRSTQAFDQTMKRLQKKWDPQDLASLAKRLHEFAESIEGSIRYGRSNGTARKTKARRKAASE